MAGDVYQDSVDCTITSSHCVYMDKEGYTLGSTGTSIDAPCLKVVNDTAGGDPKGYGVCQFFNGIGMSVFCKNPDDGIDVDYYYDYSKFTLYGQAQAQWGSKSGTKHSGEAYTALPGDSLSVKCHPNEPWPGGFK